VDAGAARQAHDCPHLPIFVARTNSFALKLADTILLSLAVGFFVIGVHQTFYVGLAASYWLFMLSGGLVLWLKLLRDKARLQAAPPAAKTPPLVTSGKAKPAKKAKR
jgi:hypothetical protein